MQNEASMVFDSRHARMRLANQSITRCRDLRLACRPKEPALPSYLGIALPQLEAASKSDTGKTPLALIFVIAGCPALATFFHRNEN
jgi:hypothetical protein